MDLSIALKLVLAAVLGGVIGLERQIRDKPAGLRTNMLICMGATQFMAISSRVAVIMGGDPTRIAAQIITGIGFLGAGAVMQSHGFVTGLTTAATIWVVAGVGMAIGAAFYGTAILATGLTVVTLYFFSLLEDRFQKDQLQYSLVVSDLEQGLNAVHRILRENKVTAIDLSFKKGEEKNHDVRFQTKVSAEVNEKILYNLSREPVIAAVNTAGSAEGSDSKK
jgi:putative Mg2+ transporter-C (MgtC) family protein